MPESPVLRPARVEDMAPIRELMRLSVLAHFPAFYDAEQTRSAADHTARLDPALVQDGTYLVHDAGGEIVSCGGWSRRAKLFAGPADAGTAGDPDRLLDPATEPARIRAMFVREGWSRRGLAGQILDRAAGEASAAGFTSLVLVATLPGVPLYLRYGFVEQERIEIVHPDGVRLEGVLMGRAAQIGG